MTPLEILTQFGPLVATGAGAVLAGGIRARLGEVRGTIAEAIPALQAHVERHSGEIRELEVIVATLPSKFEKLELRVVHMDEKMTFIKGMWEERCQTCPARLHIRREREKGTGGEGT